MKLHEALSKSNKVRRSCWYKGMCFDYAIGGLVDSHGPIDRPISSSDFQDDDWEPIFEKKIIKKKMYQAVIKTNPNSYFMATSLYCDEYTARKDYPAYFVKLLTDRPIEVEVEEV